MKLPRWVGHYQSFGNFRRLLQTRFSPLLSLGLLITAAPVLLLCVKPAFSNRGTIEAIDRANLIAQSDDQSPVEQTDGSSENYPQEDQSQ